MATGRGAGGEPAEAEDEDVDLPDRVLLGLPIEPGLPEHRDIPESLRREAERCDDED